MLVVTYCVIMILTFVLACLGRVNGEVFLGMFAGLSGLATFVVKSYFDRNDRGGKNVE